MLSAALPGPTSLFFRKRLVSGNWNSVAQTWAVRPEETWRTNGKGVGGWEAKAEEASGLAGSSRPKLAREVDKEHNFEPVSWAPSAQGGI